MRLVASVEIAGRDRDFGRKQRTLAVKSAAMEYREQMRRLASSATWRRGTSASTST